MLILRRRFSRQIGSWSVSPLLYLIAFRLCHGKRDYHLLAFLPRVSISGLAVTSSMTQSFAIGSEINIARFYWHIFEEFQAAPISNTAYVFGEVLASMTRALLAGIVIIFLWTL